MRAVPCRRLRGGWKPSFKLTTWRRTCARFHPTCKLDHPHPPSHCRTQECESLTGKCTSCNPTYSLVDGECVPCSDENCFECEGERGRFAALLAGL